MCHISLLRSFGRYRATHSINIPRLWRSGIREFANSIRVAARTHFVGVHSFSQRNFIRADEGRYSLTELGKKYAERVVTSEFNGKMLLRKIRSLRGGSSDVFLEW